MKGSFVKDVLKECYKGSGKAEMSKLGEEKGERNAGKGVADI
jgi:hypothetical protein